jgi:hypothetical protein
MFGAGPRALGRGVGEDGEEDKLGISPPIYDLDFCKKSKSKTRNVNIFIHNFNNILNKKFWE